MAKTEYEDKSYGDQSPRQDPIAQRVCGQAHSVADLSLRVTELAREKTITLIIPELTSLNTSSSKPPPDPIEVTFPPLFAELRGQLNKINSCLLEIQELLLKSEV